MEHSSDKDPSQNNIRGRSSLYWGLALVAVLIVGVAIGYLFSQSQTTPNAPVQIAVTATLNPTEQPVVQANQQPPPTQTNEQPTQPPAQSNPPVTTATEDSTNTTPPTPTIMDFVLSDARHFQGNADAPVTIVEFSDFK
jgi:cytoskeletal protein RodZ